MRNARPLLLLVSSLVACGNSPAAKTADDTSAASNASTDSMSAAPPPNTDAPKDKKLEVASGNAVAANPVEKAADPPKKIDTFVIARPPFDYVLKRAVTVDATSALKLVKVSEKKNNITDDDAWFSKNGLKLPGRQPSGGRFHTDTPLASTPAEIGPNKLQYLLDHGDHTIALYGPAHNATRVVMLLDAQKKPKAIFDFNSFVKPPEVAGDFAPYTDAQVSWAIEKDGVLYVETGHDTYAKASKGKNAFLNAIDVKTGELLWQSAPLVCNARNFVIVGSHIICGYGFTAEPDFMYVISRADGKTVQKLPISTGPTYLVMKDGKLFVRAYDTDFVFDVR